MSRKKSESNRPRILLSRRALRDLREIEEFSAKRWGKRTAERYLDAIDAALGRIAENSKLLREEPEFGGPLRFYRVEKHLLICDVQPNVIHVLAVLHAGMDIPSRLAELEPSLSCEADILHDKLTRRPTRE